MRVVSAPKNTGRLIKNTIEMPIQIPGEILKSQTILGPTATLVWINLAACAQRGQAVQIDDLANVLGIEEREISRALTLLADQGWINDGGLEIEILLPERCEEKEVSSEGILDPQQAAFEWLIDYLSTRVAPPSHQEMRKLLHWVERRGLSHEVIAVAIEEMRENASIPNFSYLEAILKNWHNFGIRTYNDLLENPQLAKVLQPIASQKEEELTPAEKRWKEVFPDEFD